MEEFGRILGITKSGISDIENGRRSVTDQHIKMLTIQPLKGKYLNETWLRTGEGEMFRKRTDNEILTEFAADLVFEADDSFKKAIVTTFAKMDDDTWDHFEKWARTFLEQFHEIKKEQD